MASILLEQFEQAIKGRSPILAERLQPGLPEAKIRKMLQRTKVSGNAESIVQLFSWKDGSELYTTISSADATPLPHSPFMFLDLEMMVTHFNSYKELVPYQPRFKSVAGKYFPFLWDGSDKWIAVDLEGGSVALLETQLEDMVRPLHKSFEDFIQDTIQANQKNERLTCLPN